MIGEASFLLKRAEEEAILAIRSDQTPAAGVHFELAVRYSARARAALTPDQVRSDEQVR